MKHEYNQECTYDYMGRRATKKVTVNGSVTLHHPPPQTLSAMARRACYACLPSQSGNTAEAGCDLTRTAHPCLWLITWDPSQATATRPLAIQKDGTWYTYGWDLTKNICEVYGQHGYIRTTYTYSPYGQVTATGDVTQPIQWSSEYNDTELALVYYNYRHYNPTDGRWLGRDRYFSSHLYLINNNNNLKTIDNLGLKAIYIETPIIEELYSIPGAEEDISCSGLTSVFIKRKYNLEWDKTSMKCQCVERIAEWTVIAYILAANSYELQNIRGTLYLTDKEKKRDIISKLRKKPQGISKAEYLTSLDLPSNSFTLNPSGDTYEGNKHHEMVHKKQILMHKKEIQRIMDSYKTLGNF